MIGRAAVGCAMIERAAMLDRALDRAATIERAVIVRRSNLDRAILDQGRSRCTGSRVRVRTSRMRQVSSRHWPSGSVVVPS